MHFPKEIITTTFQYITLQNHYHYSDFILERKFKLPYMVSHLHVQHNQDRELCIDYGHVLDCRRMLPLLEVWKCKFQANE